MVSKMATIAWHIWKCRCDLVFSNKLTSIQQLTVQINRFLNNSASVTRDTSKANPSHTMPTWSPPLDDYENIILSLKMVDMV